MMPGEVNVTGHGMRPSKFNSPRKVRSASAMSIEMHVDPKMIRPHAQIKFPIGGRKLIERVTMVRRMAAQPIEHLDKRMRGRSILAQKHAGNDRVNVLLRRIDKLEIPAFKKTVLLAMTVIHGRPPHRPQIR